MPSKIERIALFGGSFDPVHHGHLEIASAAVSQAGLDRVIFLPAAKSPLKDRGPVEDGGIRLEMIQAAIAGLPWAEVSDWELRKKGPSFSWETAEHFTTTSETGIEWFWLMGADQWEVLERWRRWEYLASMVVFLVFGRSGGGLTKRPGVRAKFLRGQFPGSSTEVRFRIASGESLEGLVPPAVGGIIREKKLYVPRA